jgi:hypothetical protein
VKRHIPFPLPMMPLLTELGMLVGPRSAKTSPLAGLRLAHAYPIINQCFMPYLSAIQN